MENQSPRKSLDPEGCRTFIPKIFALKNSSPIRIYGLMDQSPEIGSPPGLIEFIPFRNVGHLNTSLYFETALRKKKIHTLFIWNLCRVLNPKYAIGFQMGLKLKTNQTIGRTS